MTTARFYLLILSILVLSGCGSASDNQGAPSPTMPATATNRGVSTRCANYADSVLALGSYQVPAPRMLVDGRNLYLTNYYGPINILSDINPQKAHIVATVPIVGFNSITVHDGYLYVVTAERGLSIVDVSPPANAHVVGELQIPFSFDVFAVGHFLFVGDGSTLRSIDIANPRVPRLVGSIDTRTGIFIEGFAAHGNYLYVARNQYYGDNEGSALIVDISNPAAMREVGTFGWDFMLHPQVEGDYLGMLNDYPDAGSHFYLFDVSTGIPTNPRSLNFNCGDFVIVGDYLYATEVPFLDYTGEASGPNRLVVMHLPDMTVVGTQEGDIVGDLSAGEHLYSINWPLDPSTPTMSIWPLQCR